MTEEHLFDILDPEPVDRPQWQGVYMGEKHPERCGNCARLRKDHDATDSELYCFEAYLRVQDGNR